MQESLAIDFGTPRATFIFWVGLSVFFFVVLAIVYRWLVQTEGDRSKLSATLGGRPFKASRRTAILILLPMWLVASGWQYQSHLGSRFYSLRSGSEGGKPVWELTYEYPHRVVRLPADLVERWERKPDWSQRNPRAMLVIIRRDGSSHRSAAITQSEFNAHEATLNKAGLTIIDANPSR